MDEHLLGVRINDQKAHLQKVFEEIRIKNVELVKTFSQIEEATQKLATINNEIAAAQESLAAELKRLDSARQQIVQAQDDAQRIVAEANNTNELASDKFKAVVVYETKAMNRVDTLKSDIVKLEALTVSAEEGAAKATQNLRSLEQECVALQTEVATLSEERTQALKVFEQDVSEWVRQLDAIEKKTEQAKELFEKEKSKIIGTFIELDDREKRVKVRENDTEILKERLARRFVEIKQEYGRHLGAK